MTIRSSPRARGLTRISLLLAAAAVAGGALVLAAGSGRADAPKVASVYLSVTGDGPTARTWYDGAPPAGVPVQDALNQWSGEGYRIVEVTRQAFVSSEDRPVTTVWAILMERVE